MVIQNQPISSECYRGVTINKTTYTHDPRYSIWTTGVGGSGTQGYGSMADCKSHIDALYNKGFSFSQCTPTPIPTPTPQDNTWLFLIGLGLAAAIILSNKK